MTKAFNSNASVNIVGLGEVLWDVFPDGPHFGGAGAKCDYHTLGACFEVLRSLNPKT